MPCTRFQAEEEIRQAEERFTKVFKFSPNAMAVNTFPDGRFVNINDSFISLTGYKQEEIIGFNPIELKIFDQDLLEKAITKLYESGSFKNLEADVFTSKGERKTGLFSAEIVTIDDQQHILTVFNDLTEYKMFEKEIGKLERLNLIGKIAAAIGHEVRNPMTTVRGFLQLMSSREEIKKYNEQFSLMIEELDRANSIITEFLSLAGNKASAFKKLNLNSIIQNLYPLLLAEALASDKNINLSLSDLPLINMEEREIRQLIFNLVQNGLEAMTRGGELQIKTFMSGYHSILSIKDHGIGINPGVIDEIGTPFFTTKEKGTGLGLAVCYSIARRHNAQIEFDTSPSGTTFYVRFPK